MFRKELLEIQVYIKNDYVIHKYSINEFFVGIIIAFINQKSLKYT
jgi:hypothetical protein